MTGQTNILKAKHWWKLTLSRTTDPNISFAMGGGKWGQLPPQPALTLPTKSHHLLNDQAELSVLYVTLLFLKLHSMNCELNCEVCCMLFILYLLILFYSAPKRQLGCQSASVNHSSNIRKTSKPRLVKIRKL